LAEEFKLRAKQPMAWTRIKYRKNVKLPKDLMRKAKRKFKDQHISPHKIKLRRRKFKSGKRKKR